MKKIVLLLIIALCLSFCSCTGESLYTVHYPKPVVVEPGEDATLTINGYKDTTKIEEVSNSNNQSSQAEITSSNTPEYNGKYLGNKNTKKLHKTDCSYIKKTKEENIEIFEDINSAVSQGFVKCSRCLKD